MQSSRWKLVRGIREGVHGSALFDLVADPDEGVNVASTHTDEVKALLEFMKIDAQRDAELLPRIEDIMEQLRAIGYME